ncbi:MAG: ComF family protein [Verrucomicrobiota bacterium]|jgi:ComF family protein|nr:ComF family protein [Verrucomicrobiota bacterium]
MKTAFLDLVFSRSCEGCGCALGAEEEGALCGDCRSRLQVVRLPFCERCGDPVSGAFTSSFECAWCRRVHPAFDWARSAVRYQGVVRTCLRSFKYQAGFWLLADVEQWLTALWRTCPASVQTADWVTSVPLYPRRERERGYNQASVLAARLAKKVGIPFRDRVLWRWRPTATQTRLTAAQRAHNVKGVFAVPRPRRVEGARVVLVDDVMTTGATVNECARVLKAAGAASVMVLSAARG